MTHTQAPTVLDAGACLGAGVIGRAPTCIHARERQGDACVPSWGRWVLVRASLDLELGVRTVDQISRYGGQLPLRGADLAYG